MSGGIRLSNWIEFRWFFFDNWFLNRSFFRRIFFLPHYYSINYILILLLTSHSAYRRSSDNFWVIFIVIIWYSYSR